MSLVYIDYSYSWLMLWRAFQKCITYYIAWTHTHQIATINPSKATRPTQKSPHSTPLPPNTSTHPCMRHYQRIVQRLDNRIVPIHRNTAQIQDACGREIHIGAVPQIAHGWTEQPATGELDGGVERHCDESDEHISHRKRYDKVVGDDAVNEGIHCNLVIIYINWVYIDWMQFWCLIIILLTKTRMEIMLFYNILQNHKQFHTWLLIKGSTSTFHNTWLMFHIKLMYQIHIKHPLARPHQTKCA